ncbi:MAG: insulinase family protein [Asticcacaulis sp.]|nr:insulinase family protein [Asticcacaulis sp.]
MAQPRVWRLLTAFSLILALVGVLPPARAADTLMRAMAGPEWPHSQAELKPDANARFGRLPNGMRYVIYRNRAKARGASMRFEIAAGSLQERDDQRGLAHFVEHMAFRGSKNLADGELTNTLKREGFTFGTDVNAFTDYENTKYVLDLPGNDDEPVDSALFILREVAGNLTFDGDAIEHERGVILGEERMRASPTSRARQAVIETAFHDRPYALRDPIGTLDSIRTAPRQAIIDYYQDWYRPELAMLIVVGDFDVDKMEQKIRKTFGDWKPARPGPINMIDYGGSTVTGPHTMVHTEKNLYDAVAATWYRPYIDNPDTYRSRQRGFMKHLAVTVINEQFFRAAEAPETAFLSATITYDNTRLEGNTTVLWVVPKPGRQKEAFIQALRLLNRFKAKGVSQQDVADYIATTDAQMDNVVRLSQTRSSDAIAEDILSTLNDEGHLRRQRTVAQPPGRGPRRVRRPRPAGRL